MITKANNDVTTLKTDVAAVSTAVGSGGSGGGTIDPAILSGLTSDIASNKIAINSNIASIALNCDGIGLNELEIGDLF